MLDADGRVVLVSGANRGIGRAIAARLLEGGYTLSLGARRPEALEAVFGEEDSRRSHHRFDAENRDTLAQWVAGTIERHGRIDGLVNNAGVDGEFTLERGEESELDRLWAVNCKAPLFLIRLCLPHLRKSGAGRIVNVSSLSGKRVRNENVAYTMTKHALLALSHTARRIGWEDGVRVVTVCPSFVDTDMTAHVTKVAPEQMINPSDLAELTATVIALPNTASVAELLVNCGFEDAW